MSDRLRRRRPELELDDEELDEERPRRRRSLDDDLDDVDDVVCSTTTTSTSSRSAPRFPSPVVTDDTATTATETAEDEEDDVVDLDEELHPDDVEEPLDVLLQERTASATLEDDEEELEDEEIDGDDRGDGPTRIVPRRPDEFLCQSCFLVLPLRRLADKERQFCDDCA